MHPSFADSLSDYPDYGGKYAASIHEDANLTASSDASSYSFSLSGYYFAYDWGVEVDHDARIVLYTVSFVILLLLVVIGIVANAIQLHCIVAFPWVRRSVENVFIAHVTVVDLVYLSLVGTVNLYLCGLEAFWPDHVSSWIHTLDYHIPALHKYVVYLQRPVFVQLATMMTALAFDQYIVIVHPILARRWRTVRNALKASIATAIVSVILVIVEAVSDETIDDSRTLDVVLLTEEIFFFVFFTLVPIVAILGFNIAMSKTLRSARPRSDAESQRANNAQRFAQLQEEHGSEPGALVRASELPSVTAITASFVVCWVIRNVLQLMTIAVYTMRNFQHPLYSNNRLDILVQFMEIAVHFNVALNPFLYALSNPKFRHHMSRVVCGMLPQHQSLENHVPLSEDAQRIE